MVVIILVVGGVTVIPISITNAEIPSQDKIWDFAIKDANITSSKNDNTIILSTEIVFTAPYEKFGTAYLTATLRDEMNTEYSDQQAVIDLRRGEVKELVFILPVESLGKHDITIEVKPPPTSADPHHVFDGDLKNLEYNSNELVNQVQYIAFDDSQKIKIQPKFDKTIHYDGLRLDIKVDKEKIEDIQILHHGIVISETKENFSEDFLVDTSHDFSGITIELIKKSSIIPIANGAESSFSQIEEKGYEVHISRLPSEFICKTNFCVDITNNIIILVSVFSSIVGGITFLAIYFILKNITVRIVNNGFDINSSKMKEDIKYHFTYNNSDYVVYKDGYSKEIILQPVEDKI